MGKFNSAKGAMIAKPSTRATSPIVTASTATLRTHEGGAGFERTARSELFLAVVGAFIAEDSFYETGQGRMNRVRDLVHTVALQDDGMTWLGGFVPWLRNVANIRTAPVVIVAEAVRALIDAKRDANARALVRSAISRADEPGELVAYWLASCGEKVPNSIKRGIADAVTDIYSEYSALKYDTASTAQRFGKIITLTHPVAKDARQADLFRHLIERSRNWRDGVKREIPESLAVVRARHELESVPVAARRSLVAEKVGVPIAERLRAAGATWEYLSGWLADGKGMDKAAWEAVIPSMGFMALARNLRNFDEAGVSDEVAATIAAKLSDPQEVARSRQFPFRFLAAYENAPSLRWAYPLEKALQASLANIPAMPGRSLVLVDTSASMASGGFSKHSKMTPAMAAAIFGTALAAKGEQVDLWGFANGVFQHRITKGASVLTEVQAFLKRIGEVGHGTNIHNAVQRTLNDHDRVFIISDMQTIGGHYGSGVSSLVPATTPVYGFNLGGYKAAAMATGSGNRHEFGGLSDATFRLVPLIEAGQNAVWPWEQAAR